MSRGHNILKSDLNDIYKVLNSELIKAEYHEELDCMNIRLGENYDNTVDVYFEDYDSYGKPFLHKLATLFARASGMDENSVRLDLYEIFNSSDLNTALYNISNKKLLRFVNKDLLDDGLKLVYNLNIK